LKHLETIRAVATNIGVVPETEAACQIVLHGCPLVSPPAVQYGALTDAAHKNDQNASKTPDDFLTTKNNPYFKGQFYMTLELLFHLSAIQEILERDFAEKIASTRHLNGGS